VPVPRPVLLVPMLCVLLLAGTPPSARAGQRALPETVTVHDSRTSAPIVDISEVRLDASWYWDSEQSLRVKVPHGYQPGHRLTVWFDLNGDSKPDGHFQLDLRKPKHPGGTSLQKAQEFRRGGGWGHSGTRAPCGGSEGGPPVVDQLRRGQRSVSIHLDLWWCLGAANPPALDSGSWRAAVSLKKGKNEDMAPNHRGWSAPVAGWGPCDPAGGAC
jgi:hypothetical protein